MASTISRIIRAIGNELIPVPQTSMSQVRMDSGDARLDCGAGGCLPAPNWGSNGWFGSPREWATLPPGLSMIQIDNLCIDQLMYRIVNRLVDDCMTPSGRPGLTGEVLGQLTHINGWLENKGFFEAAMQAMIYARRYGGGGVVCFINDGRPSNEEVDIFNVKSIEGFYALPKWYLTPLDSGSGRIEQAWYGQRIGRPERYAVTPTAIDTTGINVPETIMKKLNESGNIFHRSRIIPWMFRPDMDLRQARMYMNWGGWGPGVVEACLAPFLNRKTGALRLADIVNSVVFNVLKMPNVATAMSTPSGGSPLMNALGWIKACLAFTGDGLPLVAIDSLSEIQAINHNVSGIDKLVSEQRRYLLDVIEYPEVVIFSSGGANGLSGDANEGQWRNYYQTVQSTKESWCWNAGAFGGGIKQAVLLAMAAKNGPTDGYMDLTVKPTWPNVWVDSDKNRAETRLKDAEARASDALVLGMTGMALAQLDPTVAKAYPALDVTEPGQLPGFFDGQVGAAPSEVQAKNAKAAMTSGAATTALAEAAEGTTDTQAVQDAIPVEVLTLPKDIATEKEIAVALRMTRPALRKWLMTHGKEVQAYPTPAGTRGGYRYSLGEVLKAWNSAAQLRLDSLRTPIFDNQRPLNTRG